MSEGRLYFFNKPYPGRPIEDKYIAEIDGLREFFMRKEDALLYLFDQGVKQFQYLTKELPEYINTKNLLTYEFWQLENRVGYVQHDYERYVDQNDEVQKRKAFVWRFVGFGRSTFAPTHEKLKEKVLALIHHYNGDPDECGHNTYPFYIRHYRPQGVHYKPMNFIAFDFETANRHRHSICSVGMVFVRDGQITDSLYQLINPEEEFDDFNIMIHGITPDDVKSAPTFDRFYETVKERIQDKLMVAHYLAFDGNALRDNLARYEIQPVLNHLLCTYQLSKRLVPGQSSYSIKSLCQHYGIELTNHHHALDDAKACARLMLKLVEENELTDFDTIYSKTLIKAGEISSDKYQSSLVNKIRNRKSFNLSDIEVATDVGEHSEFYEKNIVFTGRLSVFTRTEAAQLIASKGGRPQNGLNKETDYIILGGFDDVMIKGNKSSKLEKAEKMIQEGKELEIISEEDFLKML
jgi:DNA polymerase-3 subunit epsilon